MEGPEIDAAISELQALQAAPAPVQAPPGMVMRLFTPQATEVVSLFYW